MSLLQKEVLQTRSSYRKSSEKKDDGESLQIKELLRNLPQLEETFEVHRKIGEGTFSTVYLGSLKKQQGLPEAQRCRFAIKHLVPTVHPNRIEHELRCLREIGGKHNVIGVDLCLRNLDTVVFVMPYIPHTRFSEFIGDMDAHELAAYMRALLSALKHVHSFGVIHRDIKPSNFLYDRENRRYFLVDFGLAQRLYDKPGPSSTHSNGLKRSRPNDDLSADSAPQAKRKAVNYKKDGKGVCVTLPASSNNLQQAKNGGTSGATDGAGSETAPSGLQSCMCSGVGGVCSVCARWPQLRAPRAGTQGFRPPEVLLKVSGQTVAVDVWASGVVAMAALCARCPFLRARDDVAALAEIVDLLGTDAIHRTAAAFQRCVVVSARRRGLCLRKLCAWLRRAPPPPAPPRAAPGAPCDRCSPYVPYCICQDDVPATVIRPEVSVAGFPDSAFALAARLLEPDPNLRITAAEALEHPFLKDW